MSTPSPKRPRYVICSSPLLEALSDGKQWDLPPELEALKKKVAEEEAYKVERERRKAAGEARYASFLLKVTEEALTSYSPTPPPRSGSFTPEHLQSSSRNAIAAYSPKVNDAVALHRPPMMQMYPNRDVVTMPPGGFLTLEKAEAAFFYLLKREGIDEHSTWDTTMRKIIMDPLYKALDTLAQKKAAFEKVSLDVVCTR